MNRMRSQVIDDGFSPVMNGRGFDLAAGAIKSSCWAYAQKRGNAVVYSPPKRSVKMRTQSY